MISSFKGIEKKYDVHRSKKCMKTFWESLREPVVVYGLVVFLEQKSNKKN